MKRLYPKLLMEQTASIIADTNYGWTNSEITKKFNEYCLKFSKSFQYDKGQYENKALAYKKNFSKFSEEELYSILKEIFRDDKFINDESIKKAFNNLIKDNAIEYEDTNEEYVETFTLTSHFLEKYENAFAPYQSAYQKITANIYERNALDDLRLSLELLIKELLSNNRSLENNIEDLSKLLKEKNVLGEINSLFNLVLKFYTRYQNEYVKHNDAVESNSVEFVFDLTSTLLKYLCRIF